MTGVWSQTAKLVLQTAGTSVLTPCRELEGDLWVTHINVNVLSLPSEPAASVPWVIPALDELGEVNPWVPEGIRRSQRPEDGELIQELSHVAQGHVKVHREDTCGEQGQLLSAKLHPHTSPSSLTSFGGPFLKTHRS